MGKKILLVDDEEFILNSLKRDLYDWAEENELSILTSISGEKALETLKTENRYVAVIVSDQRMPGLKGSEFLLRVKSLYPDIVSIILTAYTDIEDAINAIKAGIFAFVIKSADRSTLLMEIGKALKVYNLQEDNRRYLKMIKEELRWGGELQKTLLKIDLPESSKISFSVSYLPLPELNCGGDYYDIIPLAENTYLLLIGDVAGHGIRAAFVSAILKSTIFSVDLRHSNESLFSLPAFLSWLNNRICEELERLPDMVITFSSCLIDLNKKTLKYSNAGHLPTILIRNNDIKMLRIPGMGMGFSKGVSYDEMSIEIKKGDRIIMYTDGLHPTGGESSQYKEEDFLKLLAENASKNNFNRRIIDAVGSKLKGAKFSDDVTLITADIKALI